MTKSIFDIEIIRKVNFSPITEEQITQMIIDRIKIEQPDVVVTDIDFVRRKNEGIQANISGHLNGEARKDIPEPAVVEAKPEPEVKDEPEEEAVVDTPAVSEAEPEEEVSAAPVATAKPSIKEMLAAKKAETSEPVQEEVEQKKPPRSLTDILGNG